MVPGKSLDTKTVLLDFDGTLADSASAIITSMSRTMEYFGYPAPSAEIIRSNIGMPLTQSLSSYFGGDTPPPNAELIRVYRTFYPEEEARSVKLYPGVLETLRQVRQAGLFISVVSNKGEVVLEKTVVRFGLDKVVDLVRGQVEDVPSKPHPRFFQERILPHLPNGHGAPNPAAILMVGDAWQDMAFARNIGARACYATYGFGDPESCLEHDPDHSIDSFWDLATVLGLEERPPEAP